MYQAEIIQSAEVPYLLFPVVISPLKLPVYQGSLWLRTALQERATVLHSIDDSLLKAVPMVII